MPLWPGGTTPWRMASAARATSQPSSPRHAQLLAQQYLRPFVSCGCVQAAGSSLLAKLASLLAADALRLAGLTDVGASIVLPSATGLALMLTLRELANRHPAGARHVIWPRIDQKTCLKCITAAGLVPVVIENQLASSRDQLTTDLDAIASAVQRLGSDSVLCVLTTTSCFAPRAADDVVAVAKLCAQQGAPWPHCLVMCSKSCLQSCLPAAERGRSCAAPL